MASGYQELFLEQGATFNSSLSLTDVYGDKFDLSRFDAFSQIRKSYYSLQPTAIFDVTISEDYGSIILFLSANATANVAPGRYVYDVVIKNKTDAANNTIRVLEGIVNVTPSVTK